MVYLGAKGEDSYCYDWGCGLYAEWETCEYARNDGIAPDEGMIVGNVSIFIGGWFCWRFL
jgi:hypothetical protein